MMLYSRNLGKRFKNLWALSNVNLELSSRRLVLLGQNGSGKTTLLSIITGISFPTNGEVKVNGIIPYKEREKAVEMISFSFEKPNFNIKVKVKDIVETLGVGKELIDLLEVSPFLQKNLSELSSGQQQIVNILVSLANWSEILVLDEPFANLDLRRVGKLASHLLREKKDFIVTTHVPEEAEMIGEHFIVLEGGNVVWSGSIRDLITSDIFEVFMNGESNSLNIIYRFGNIALVKNSEEELYKFLREGLIYGFRKAGVRKFYGEAN